MAKRTGPRAYYAGRTRSAAIVYEAYDPKEETKPHAPHCVHLALEALEDVQCNWRDRRVVVPLLKRMGHAEAARWIEDNPRPWARICYVGLADD